VGPSDFQKRVTSSPPREMTPIKVGKSETFEARWQDGTRALVKFSKEKLPSGKVAQRGITALSHPRREVAFWQLASLYGYQDIVPETVLFELDGAEASAQAWISAAPLSSFRKSLRSRRNPNWVSDLIAVCSLVPKTQWTKLVILDFVAGARDRHANNVGVRVLLDGGTVSHGLVAWDNAVSFGQTLRFYHQIFHKYLFHERIHLDPLWDSFMSVTEDQIRDALSGLVSPVEVEHACVRKAFLETFPYKMPWAKVSQRTMGVSSFPAYETMFREAVGSGSPFPPLQILNS